VDDSYINGHKPVAGVCAHGNGFEVIIQGVTVK